MIRVSKTHATHPKYAPHGCFPKRARHLKHKGPGNAKSYFNRPGSGLLTREEIERRRGVNPKGAY